MSAKFWAVYMDELIANLRKKKIGCHLIEVFIACVLYADDVCLLAPTWKAMQTLLDACSDYAHTWCIKYNHKKTKVMYLGKKNDSFSCAPLTHDNAPLEFVKEFKYLGVLIRSENEVLK